MIFWIGIVIALLIAVGLITSKDVYEVRRSNEAFGLIIGTVSITLIVVRLL